MGYVIRRSDNLTKPVWFVEFETPEIEFYGISYGPYYFRQLAEKKRDDLLRHGNRKI